MNKIVTKFLFAGGKFMPEMHLRQTGVTHSPCGLFNKQRKMIKKFREIGKLKYLYRNELDQALFAHK